MSEIFLLLRTVRYLKLKQIAYRLYYAFRKKYQDFVRFNHKFNLYRKGKPLVFTPIIPNSESFKANTFTFLNRSISFSDRIDWDYMDNGKLWAYNLNYFDFLNQKGMTPKIGQSLMYLFIDQLKELKNANEPYPTSLRGMNWVKFLSIHNLEVKSLDRFLYSQYRILLDNLEYHILGNHLLENGFSLLLGGYYFKGNELYLKGVEIMSIELREQILSDGAHFELTPMYHKIILHRLLDSYNLIINNRDVYEDKVFEEFLLATAEKMLGWLEKVTFKNGTTPRVNDSTEKIAPDSSQLFEYAKSLNINWKKTELSDSGYRLFENNNLELFVDYGEIGPSYIPGHAHSDTFNFVLNFEGNPIIVDPGISTYDVGPRRQRERSTSSHNTVRYGKVDQTEVWGGFRVGRRANALITSESSNSITGYHKGYSKYGVFHQRHFELNDNTVTILDKMVTKRKLLGKSSAYFHFHPNIKVIMTEKKVHVEGVEISFEGAISTRIKEYTYAHGYNLTESAKVVEVIFKDELKSNITLTGYNK
jgi:hypothetical protein